MAIEAGQQLLHYRLIEMITGRRAFEGETTAAVFDAILNRTPTAPASNPELRQP